MIKFLILNVEYLRHVDIGANGTRKSVLRGITKPFVHSYAIHITYK